MTLMLFMITNSMYIKNVALSRFCQSHTIHVDILYFVLHIMMKKIIHLNLIIFSFVGLFFKLSRLAMSLDMLHIY